MKILHVVPVTAPVMTDEIIGFISRPLAPDTQLVTRPITRGPASIESEYDEALAAPHILEICGQARDLGCEGIFINCFGDPGVRAARELTGLPVFGGFEPGVLTAMALADTFAIITVIDNVVSMIHANAAKAGVTPRMADVRVVNMPVLDLEDNEKMVAALTEQSRISIREKGAQAIVLGCTGMIGGAEAVAANLKADGLEVPVIEPAQAAVKMVETCVRLGLGPSRRTYLPIPQKTRID